MDNLSNRIMRCYLARFDELTIEKQTHFATRLYLWCQEPRTAPLLQQIRPWFTAHDNPGTALEQLIEKSRLSYGDGAENALELRLPYFKRYPNLRTYVLVLFRIHFLRVVYGIDCRRAFYELFPETQVLKLRDDLLNKPKALSILSTRAINFLYLLERTIHQDDTTLPVKRFLDIGHSAYDYLNKTHLQLLIYLYTHCIIGDSQFYYRHVPETARTIYQTMLRELDALIDKHFAEINMDNKFEFLVCCKIMGYQSKTQTRIFEEASKSLSPQENFIIDRHNHNPQAGKATFALSEHRNVLFIMANRSFTPLG